ncbi:CsbD family protein [Nocardia sp. NPDC049190]|uniref:CsbD family protein n=1 Tax=Nocardia sp. NPDC049190 TaxID=3155650 RepID=UPI0033D7B80D
MSTVDKAKNKAQNLAGKTKEKLGEATGDRDQKNKGRSDQVKSDVKDAGEKVKDAFRH